MERREGNSTFFLLSNLKEDASTSHASKKAVSEWGFPRTTHKCWGGLAHSRRLDFPEARDSGVVDGCRPVHR